MNRFEVNILGCSSATPTSMRFPTSQLINFYENLYLVDCGEGTQMQLRRYRHKMNNINHIFISHLHGDHYFGLIGLLSSLHLLGRTQDLQLYGPEPLMDILISQFRASNTYLRYYIHFTPTDPKNPKVLVDDKFLKVTSFPLDHRIDTCGFLFQEQNLQRHIIRSMVDEFEVPQYAFNRLKNGEDFAMEDGTVIKNTDVTSPATKARLYAFCSDTAYSEAILPFIKNADLLYHEATFMNDLAQRAAETKHSTTYQAASIALKAEVNQLLIGHYSARYHDVEPLLAECKEIFENTLLAKEGSVFRVG
jgi:ribonuclease Z